MLKIFFSANALAQLLTVPPYVVAAIVMLSLSYASDKLQTRGIFLCVGCSLGGIGYLYVCSLDPHSFFLTHTFAISDFCLQSQPITMFGTLLHFVS